MAGAALSSFVATPPGEEQLLEHAAYYLLDQGAALCLSLWSSCFHARPLWAPATVGQALDNFPTALGRLPWTDCFRLFLLRAFFSFISLGLFFPRLSSPFSPRRPGRVRSGT